MSLGDSFFMIFLIMMIASIILAFFLSYAYKRRKIEGILLINLMTLSFLAVLSIWFDLIGINYGIGLGTINNSKISLAIIPEAASFVILADVLERISKKRQTPLIVAIISAIIIGDMMLWHILGFGTDVIVVNGLICLITFTSIVLLKDLLRRK